MNRLLSREESGSHWVETWESDSAALGCPKRVTVLAPGNRRPAPVVYLLHGFGGNRVTWLRQTHLLRHLQHRQLLVVLPESGRRWFVNDVRGHRYEDYLVAELVPFVDRQYAAVVAGRPRAIGGFSMGGAAALMQALRHPALFSMVASHAGAFEAPARVGDPYALLRSDAETAIPSTAAHERVWGPPGSAVRREYDLDGLLASVDPQLAVYADIGVDDYPRMLAMNRRTAAKLAALDVHSEYHERPGAHDLGFLNRALPHSLDFVAQRSRALTR